MTDAVRQARRALGTEFASEQQATAAYSVRCRGVRARRGAHYTYNHCIIF